MNNMFNLEQTISEWRKQMLSAGIKTPAPLEELDIHLREEIERHSKSGLNEAEAFQAAVETIGQAQMLQKEFKKVEKRHKIIRAIILDIGWLAASCALAYSVVLWELEWNFLVFAPKWDLKLIPAMLGILVALTAIWFSVKASQDMANFVVSLLLSVLLAGFAVFLLRGDDDPNIMGGSKEVPLWYWGGRTLLLCVPGRFLGVVDTASSSQTARSSEREPADANRLKDEWPRLRRVLLAQPLRRHPPAFP